MSRLLNCWTKMISEKKLRGMRPKRKKAQEEEDSKERSLKRTKAQDEEGPKKKGRKLKRKKAQ